MATATKSKTAKGKTKGKTSTKAAAKPAETKPVAAGQEEVTFGASDLAKHLSEGRDKPVSTRELRTLIRKMARDGKGRVKREIIAGNRSRYNWSGVDDPEVVAIIKAFNDGELEADKQEKLQALKDRKAAQRAEKAAAAEEEDDEEVEEDDEDVEDDDE
jgi:hypothetical protein